MSICLMSHVWDQQFTHAEQAVMLALAYHANDDGDSCFPSIRRLAWMTGYSERQVQRIMHALMQRQVLAVARPAGRHSPPHYHVHLDAASAKTPFHPRGDKMAPQADDRGDAAMAPQETARGDTIMAPQEAARGDTTMAPQEAARGAISGREKPRGDISNSPEVTFSASRGDIAMAPDPSGDPSGEEPSDSTPLAVGAPQQVLHPLGSPVPAAVQLSPTPDPPPAPADDAKMADTKIADTKIVKEENRATAPLLNQLAAACGVELAILPARERRTFAEAAAALAREGYTPRNIADSAEQWAVRDWRGRRGEPPRLPDLLMFMPRCCRRAPRATAPQDSAAAFDYREFARKLAQGYNAIT